MLTSVENPNFWDDCVITAIEIAASKENIYNAVYRTMPRPVLCPKMEDVTVVFDDGVVQEFTFDAATDDGGTRRIRTISRCEGDMIEFFQPTPPVYLGGYFARWIFTSLAEHCCKITAENFWKMNAFSYKRFLDEKNLSTTEKVRQHIALYSNAALEGVKEKFK